MSDFVHGVCKVCVHEAEDLADCDTTFGFDIVPKNYSDPDVKITIDGVNLGKTRTIQNNLNPSWEEHFHFFLCHYGDEFLFTIRDIDHTTHSENLGRVAFPLERLKQCEEEPIIEEWFDLKQGKMKLSIEFQSREAMVGLVQDRCVLSYFPLTEGNKVTLYQDAETPPLPVFEGVTKKDDSQYVPPCAWRDLYEALCEAQKFIYITGWSVSTKISLLRDDDDAIAESNVGELLKRRAEEGVKVIVVVWDERTSNGILPGFMGTHDEETFNYFADSDVECFCHSRTQGTDHMGVKGIFASNFAATCYSHHQKTVIYDAPGNDGLLQVKAFIGGLDITDGRYDTTEYHLFKTLATHHSNCEDFYSKCCPGATAATGPREPWHDIHARIEGPGALQIHQNFVERIMRQSEEATLRLYPVSDGEFNLESNPEFDDEDESWSFQLFRSITMDGAVFKDVERQHLLHTSKGNLVEHSIFRAYVQMIRNANSFVYIENQYFLGSAYNWSDDHQAQANHTIPREIAKKIVEKIAAGEPFAVYIVVPMFPEGVPSEAAIQEILFWQYRTMESMYQMIAAAIEEHGVGTSPSDYLMFFCLAKQEGPDDVPEDLEPAEPETPAETIRTTLRHPIYVHSKMMIVDDDYVIVGSANINQRSLGGNRDSEIAFGSWQPAHTWDGTGGEPRGGIHVFRLALWAAHLGGFDEVYLNPSSGDCIEKVKELTNSYWERYKDEEAFHDDVHLLPYPINVTPEGTVEPLEEPFNCFPDTEASVLGTKSGYMPSKLTT